MAMSRSFGGAMFTSLSPIHSSPEVIDSSPAIMRNSVDLPQPDGPTSTTKAPSAMSIDTPCSTSVAPKDFRRSRISTDAMRLILPRVAARRLLRLGRR